MAGFSASLAIPVLTLDYVHELSTDGELRLFDRSVNKLLPKLLILSRARILSLVDLLTKE